MAQAKVEPTTNIAVTMNRSFQPLRITGLIEERCQPLDGPVVRIYLQLSQPPPLGWSHSFNLAWQSVAHQTPRRVGIEGDSVWMECAPSELLHHLPELEAATDTANASHAAALERKEAAWRQQRECEAQMRAELAALADYLNPTENPRHCRRHEDDSAGRHSAVTGMLGSLWRNCRTLLTRRCD